MSQARLLLLTAAAFGLSLTPAQGATRIELNGEWQLRIDPAGEGEKAGWTKVPPAATETVRVPHTWGIGKHEEHEGRAWYFRRFALPQALLGQHSEIRFGATFYRSRVWLNGTLLGEHEGGHTAYTLDATRAARADNLLVVELDNRPGAATIPGWSLRLAQGGNIWYDWWHYGGIVRDVALTFHDRALLRRQRIRVSIDDGGPMARVHDRVRVENHSGAALATRLTLAAYAPDGAVAARTERLLTLAPGAQDVAFDLTIDPVRLWHFDDPQVYRLEARLGTADGETLDVLSDSFGARTLVIRDRRLYLNGERVRLTGMTRHEDSPWEGLAESPGTMRHDYDDMKALGVTLTRPVHYPQHPWILDYCDRHGILLIPEIPMWQFSEAQMNDPKVVALAKQMMQEMIEEAGNHPSILGWSVCNESATDTPGGVAYVKTLKEHVKALDPERFVTYADDSAANAGDPTQTAVVHADFMMMNQYFGSWAGPAELLAPRLERLGRLLPDKMIVISEFGLAGIFAPDATSADRRRIDILQSQLDEFARHDFVGGAIFWCYQDYKSHRNLRPGETRGIVEMGLVDEWRQRRPSYAVWKRRNTPARASLSWNQTYTTPTEARVVITPRSERELPSYPLHGYRVEWEVQDDDNRVLGAGGRAFSETVKPEELLLRWPEAATKALRLRLRLVRPSGLVALDETFDWWEPRSGGLSVEQMKKEGKAAP
jgi:hypothetical protein